MTTATRGGERGAALVEVAMTLPLLLLVAVSIFEFGRAYQTWQVLTNAAREGARVAVLPNATSDAVETRVRGYLQNGQLPAAGAATIGVNRAATLTIGGTTASASQITVQYPFDYMVLGPVMRLVRSDATAGSPFTMQATALMRNEAQ